MNTNTILKNIALKAEKNLKEIYKLQNENLELTNNNKLLGTNLHDANNLNKQLEINVFNLNENLQIKTNEAEKLLKKNTELTQNIKVCNADLLKNNSLLDDYKDKVATLVKVNQEMEMKYDLLYNESMSAKEVINECEEEIKRLNELFVIKKKIVTRKKSSD